MTEQLPTSEANISGRVEKLDLARVYSSSYELQQDQQRLVLLSKITKELQRTLLKRLPYISKLNMENTKGFSYIRETDLHNGMVIEEQGNNGEIEALYIVGRKPIQEGSISSHMENRTEFIIFQHNDPQNAWKPWYGAMTKEDFDLEHLLRDEEQEFYSFTPLTPDKEMILDLGGKALYLGAYSLVKSHAEGSPELMQEAEKTIAYLEKLVVAM